MVVEESLKSPYLKALVGCSVKYEGEYVVLRTICTLVRG